MNEFYRKIEAMFKKSDKESKKYTEITKYDNLLLIIDNNRLQIICDYDLIFKEITNIKYINNNTFQFIYNNITYKMKFCNNKCSILQNYLKNMNN